MDVNDIKSCDLSEIVSVYEKISDFIVFLEKEKENLSGDEDA